MQQPPLPDCPLRHQNKRSPPCRSWCLNGNNLMLHWASRVRGVCASLTVLIAKQGRGGVQGAGCYVHTYECLCWLLSLPPTGNRAPKACQLIIRILSARTNTHPSIMIECCQRTQGCVSDLNPLGSHPSLWDASASLPYPSSVNSQSQTYNVC
jgi:hypothetical protein